MDIIKRIQIFGDSIMKGVFLDDSKKYRASAELGDRMRSFGESHSLEIDNHSKFGCTIGKGFAMLKKALSTGLACAGDTVLLEYGGNDCDYDWSKVSAHPEENHQPKTPLSDFIDTYKTMIVELKQHGLFPVVMTLPPIHSARYLRWITQNGLDSERILEFLGDVEHIARFQELYSSASARVAMVTDTPCVDVRAPFLASRSYQQLICDDGIHPNQLGQRIILGTLESYAVTM